MTLNRGQLSLDFARVTFSLEGTAVQLGDLVAVVDEVAVPIGDFCGQVAKSLLVGGEGRGPESEDLVKGFRGKTGCWRRCWAGGGGAKIGSGVVVGWGSGG